MICLDASVVAKLVLDEERSDMAKALYRTVSVSGQTLVAPPILPIELTNIMRKQMRGATGLAFGDAVLHLQDFLALPIEILNPNGLHVLALSMAEEFGLPATYDAHYLALAATQDCEFWTDDQRLVRQVVTRLPFVRWLGDFAAAAP